MVGRDVAGEAPAVHFDVGERHGHAEIFDDYLAAPLAVILLQREDKLQWTAIGTRRRYLPVANDRGRCRGLFNNPLSLDGARIAAVGGVAALQFVAIERHLHRDRRTAVVQLVGQDIVLELDAFQLDGAFRAAHRAREFAAILFQDEFSLDFGAAGILGYGIPLAGHVGGESGERACEREQQGGFTHGNLSRIVAAKERVVAQDLHYL